MEARTKVVLHVVQHEPRMMTKVLESLRRMSLCCCSFHGFPVLVFHSEKVSLHSKIPLASVALASGDLLSSWRRTFGVGGPPSKIHLHCLLHSFYQEKLIPLLSFPSRAGFYGPTPNPPTFSSVIGTGHGGYI